jgi:hypothetical protein
MISPRDSRHTSSSMDKTFISITCSTNHVEINQLFYFLDLDRTDTKEETRELAKHVNMSEAQNPTKISLQGRTYTRFVRHVCWIN